MDGRKEGRAPSAPMFHSLFWRSKWFVNSLSELGELGRMFVESLFIIRFNLKINIWLIRRKTWNEIKERKLFYMLRLFLLLLRLLLPLVSLKSFTHFSHAFSLHKDWRKLCLIFLTRNNLRLIHFPCTQRIISFSSLYHYHQPSLCFPHPMLLTGTQFI